MPTAHTLALGLLLASGGAADGECHLVTNTRILALPTCNLSPAIIAQLTEDPAPPTAARARQLQRRPAGVIRRGGRVVRARPPVLMVRGNEELEHRLELEQRERLRAVAARLVAEHARDLALEERAQALEKLATAREALRRLQEQDGPAEPAAEGSPPGRVGAAN